MEKSLTYSGHPIRKRYKFQGMDISIENPAGSIRSGKDPDKKKWRSLIHFDYGYIRGTIGNDGDHLDCFIGANKDSEKVFVIHQKDIKTGKFDEDKVMLGWLTQTQAIKDYLKNYDRTDMFSGCTKMSMENFKINGFKKKPGMIKAHVKAHSRVSKKTGNISAVRAHEDSRKKKEILVYKIDPNEVDKFLKRYPKIKPAMRPFLKGGLMAGYKRFLKFKDKNPNHFGGNPKTADSPTFGKKTFYKFDWGTVSGWAEVFQCLYYGKVKSDMSKSQIKAHTRKTKSGKVVHVRAHEDSRQKAEYRFEHKGTKAKYYISKNNNNYEVRLHTVDLTSGKEYDNLYVTASSDEEANLWIKYNKDKWEDKNPLIPVAEFNGNRRNGLTIRSAEIEAKKRDRSHKQYTWRVEKDSYNHGKYKIVGKLKNSSLSKSQIKAHTRRSKKTGKIMHVRAHSDIRTKKTREDIIYDVGEKIGGARKDMYLNLWKRRITKDELALMEKNHIAVVKSVVKNNVLVPLPAEDAMGRMDAGAYYMYAAIKRRISNSPPDDPEARRDYIMTANRFNQVSRKAKTADDFFGYLAEEASWITHNNEAHQQVVNRSVKKLLTADYQTKIQNQIKIYEKKGINNLSKHDLGVMQQLAIIVRNVRIYQEGGGYRMLKPKTLKQAFAQAVSEKKRYLIIKKIGKIKVGDSTSFNNKNDAWLKFLHAAYNARGWRIEGTDKNAVSGIRVRTSSSSARTLQRGYFSAKWEDFTKKKGGGQKGGFKRDVPEKVVRTGGVKIKITKPEHFLKEFGMRGIEFGNWIDVSHGNYHIQRCGEAFYDLADVLKLNKKHMSINKRLAIAFGARGTGSASAHYEPLSEVINLTKWNGGGSVAHEWFHFLDNVLTKNQAKGLSVYGSEGKKVGAPIQAAYNALINSMYKTKEHTVTKIVTAKYNTNLRRSYRGIAEWKAKHPRSPLKAFNGMVKDLQAGRYNRWIANPKNLKKIASAIAYTYKKDFDYTRKEITTATTFSIDSAELGKDYWGSGREMFARAAESWIEDELTKAKRRNTYLVSGTKSSIYVKFTEGVAKEINPYPVGKEREAINRAFRKLFVEIRKNKSLLKSIMSIFIRTGI